LYRPPFFGIFYEKRHKKASACLEEAKELGSRGRLEQEKPMTALLELESDLATI
jgi:hypothetical protein